MQDHRAAEQRAPAQSPGYDRWVVGAPDPAIVVAAIVVAAVVVAIGYMLGTWAREIGRYAAVASAALSTILGVVILAIYAFIDLGISLGAHAESTPWATALGTLPFVTWIAAPAVAVLAGAELWSEEYRR